MNNEQRPFLASAIVGNSRMLAALTGDGEWKRLFWPNIDGPQHVQRLVGGISLNGGAVVWQDDSQWQHTQDYEQDQNILVTTSHLEDRLTVQMHDAALPGRDVLVRRLTFTNGGQVPRALRYVLFQWLRIDENPLYNSVLFDEASDSLIHFRRNRFIAVGADRVLASMTIGYPEAVLASASRGTFFGGTILHGDVAGAAVWDLGTLAPGESTVLTLYCAMGDRAATVRERLGAARRAGSAALLDEVRAYWSDWLARARPLRVPAVRRTEPAALPGIPAEPAPAAAVTTLYRRSLLVMKLMSDEQTGAIIAAPEFDPAYTSCGGYAYCWGRDAAYITVALDRAGYHDLAGAFYRWALGAQEPEGWWMHRHYADGTWGPSWGILQVDETGSILYGMAVHARLHGGEPFARHVWPAVARAADWLIGFMDPATGLPRASDDLWEERNGQHTYSAAAVYGGLAAAADLALAVGEAVAAERYRAAAVGLKAAILRETVRDGVFLRGRYLKVPEVRYLEALAAGRTVRQRTGPKGHAIHELVEDPVPDTSLLGLTLPFGVVTPDEPVMARTAARLADALWAPGAGGMRRYVGDHYRGGLNPWILCTLWLGLYEADRGNPDAAAQMLDWAVARRSETGLLAEQVDPETGRPVWVLPLTWSHAMYTLLALRLYSQ